MSTRKRTRQSLAEDPEEDELSPTKKGTTKDVLGTIKKRKLNAYDSSPSLKTPKSFISRLTAPIAAAFSFSSGKEKENVRSEEVDELSGDVDIDKESEDIWEVPEEHDIPVSRRQSVRGKNAIPDEPAKNSKKGKYHDVTSTTKAKRGPNTTPKPVAELQQPEKEVEGTPKRGRPKREIAAEVELTPKHSAGRPKMLANLDIDMVPTYLSARKNDSNNESMLRRTTAGRPRKSDILKKARTQEKEAKRKSMSQQEQGEEEEEQSSRRRSGRMGKSLIDDMNAEDNEPQPASGRRGRPKKGLEVDAIKNAPKGILTPSKNRGIRPRKSVVFEAESELDLGFKDIPKSTSNQIPKKRGRKPKEKTAEEPESTEPAEELDEADGVSSDQDVDSDDSEDAACAICKGLDSEEPNEILFCDSCDNAFHQLCYGVPVVPDGNWLCNDCCLDVDDQLHLGLDGDLSLPDISNDVPDIPGFEDHLRNMQRLLLDKLTGRWPTKLTGHDEEMAKVHQVVEQTVLAGEGNSMLVIGSRGCGKSNLVESVILDLSTEHRQNFHVVRLNGFIHTDDKLALKEIWRQLGREMEVDEDLTAKSNHADTLASLLALLSHPSELSDDQDGQTAKSVVFVLDEFDLFTTHPRQTLLYNLFDIAQARKAPIVVLGLTTRVDVVEALEKRVKSRFSHRYVHLSLPRSIPAYWEICKAGLTTDIKEFETAGFDVDVDGLDEFLPYWQSMIDDLYSKDVAFKHNLQAHFYRTKSVSGFLTSCILAIANISPKTLPLTGRTFTSNIISLAAPDSKLHILQGLSDLEIALLIAAARLDIILDTDTCNFAMAYDEYSSLTSRHKIQTSSTGLAALGASAKVLGRDVALGAWERLAVYELLVPAGIGGGAGRDFGAGGRMWKVDVGLEEITGSVDGLSGVMSKWCREI